MDPPRGLLESQVFALANGIWIAPGTRHFAQLTCDLARLSKGNQRRGTDAEVSAMAVHDSAQDPLLASARADPKIQTVAVAVHPRLLN